jgi:polysaccharide pyruvyl transferase WcaK-like protein
MRRIVLAGEVYSLNLGDGLIADTLRYLLLQVIPGSQVDYLDISRRAGWQEPGVGYTLRRALFEFGQAHLGGVYTWLNGMRLELWLRQGSLAAWREQLREADALVIGGGQLLMDNQLNFPYKLGGVAQAAREMGVPVHLAACGVGDPWSPGGGRRLREVVEGAVTVSVRDELSLARLRVYVPSANPHLSFDPAIWAAEVYGGAASKGDQIGIGVIHPHTFNQGFKSHERLPKAALVDCWLKVLAAVQSEGASIELFTNGSPADQAFALALQNATARRLNLACAVAARPVTPQALVNTLRGYRTVVATRLHANVLAAAYGIPALGLAWDSKVNAFYQALGTPERCIDLKSCLADEVRTALYGAWQIGVPGEVIQRLKAQARLGADIVAQALQVDLPDMRR